MSVALLERPDGGRVGWYATGSGTLPVLVLHATLSSSLQLWRLASSLVEPRDCRAILVDRRGHGESRLAGPGPLDVATHVEDLVAVLDAAGIGETLVVGHSFGGVVALELAARHPGRVGGVVVYEPPYAPVAPEEAHPWFEATRDRTIAAAREGGPAAAAEAFLRAVSGDAAWEALSERGREFVAAQGAGAIADVALLGLDPAGLERIDAAVGLLVGGGSDPVYGAISDGLLERLRFPRQVTLPGLAHTAPITEGATVAAAIRECLAAFGVLRPR
ncbi:MAG: hypothetical protein RL338_1597 [Chloroflexota bacterium]